MTLKQLVQGLLITALVGAILTFYAFDKMSVFSLKDGFTLNFDALSLENDKNAKSIREQKNFSIDGTETLVFKSQSTPITIIFEDRTDVEAVFEGFYKASPSYKPPTLKAFGSGKEKGAEIVSFPSGLTISLSTDFKFSVKLPLAYKNKLEVSSTSGDISFPVGELKELDLKSTSGNIDAEEIDSDSFQVKTSSGTINLNTVTSKQFSAESTSGNITIGEAAVKSVNVETTSGTVNIEKVSGDVDISSTSGNIQVAEGENVTKYQVNSNSGTIRLDGLVGGSTVKSTSGNIEATMVSIEDAIEIESTSGTVSIDQVSELNYKLSLKSSSGDIDVSMPVTVSSANDEHDFSGTVGNGGKTLTIKTTSGNIELKN